MLRSGQSVHKSLAALSPLNAASLSSSLWVFHGASRKIDFQRFCCEMHCVPLCFGKGFTPTSRVGHGEEFYTLSLAKRLAALGDIVPQRAFILSKHLSQSQYKHKHIHSHTLVLVDLPGCQYHCETVKLNFGTVTLDQWGQNRPKLTPVDKRLSYFLCDSLFWRYDTPKERNMVKNVHPLLNPTSFNHKL